MKNKVLYTLISLFALGNVSAAEIGSATRQEIGRTLSRIVSRGVTSGYQKPEPITVRVQAVKASRSRVRIYATAALANYPFREENLRAMRRLKADSGTACIRGEIFYKKGIPSRRQICSMETHGP